MILWGIITPPSSAAKPSTLSMPVRHSKLVSSREREYGNGAANFSVAHAVQVNHIQTPNGIEPKMFLKLSFQTGACCSRSGDNASVNDAFGDVAEVLTTLFHDLDLVPSDIAAGLLLLHLRTKRGREELRLRRMSQVRRPITEAPRSSANNVLTSSPTADAASRAEFSPSALSVPPSAACSPNVVTGTLHHLGSIM